MKAELWCFTCVDLNAGPAVALLLWVTNLSGIQFLCLSKCYVALLLILLLLYV